ncbi:MAG TPA: hypothetical protein VMW43_11915 [Bacteroidota bacterium]|nr:hypothetical protein [Bacteroidota bacterium]
MKTRTRTFRLLQMFFAVVFTIFTVGIPIMVSACSMMKDGNRGAACCSACGKALPAGISRPTGTACCRTSIAASRSTADYLSVTEHAFTRTAPPSYHIHDGILTAQSRPAEHPAFSFMYRTTSPPIPARDLRVSFSSLLI